MSPPFPTPMTPAATRAYRGRMRSALAAIALGAVSGALPASADASQKPYENFNLSGVIDGGIGTECGIRVHRVVEFHIHVITKPVRNSGGEAYLGMENFRSTEVLTNTATGQWLEIKAAGASKEINAIHLDGTIWAFDLQQTGALFKMLDSEGHAVLRDRGRITLRGVFDTLGDGQPGGVILAEELTGIHGKFPSNDPETFCHALVELIG